MDIERLLQLFADGDLSVWADLHREIERRNMGQEVLLRVQHWRVGPARALLKDILSSSFRSIPAGQFVMGSPDNELGRSDDEAQHAVEISYPFLLKTTPVTQREWGALMKNNPSYFSSNDRNCPVEMVSWFDALAYCNALSEKEGLKPCYDLSSCMGAPGTGNYKGPENIDCDFSANGYRLPTEAEWEYAARAGSITAFYNGDITELYGKDPVLEQIAWYSENSNETTHPVKEKLPNAWGLYDMLGNVYELCQDRYGAYSSTSPRGSSHDSDRVMRGGSWGRYARTARTANRGSGGPGTRIYTVGFRPARANF